MLYSTLPACRVPTCASKPPGALCVEPLTECEGASAQPAPLSPGHRPAKPSGHRCRLHALVKHKHSRQTGLMQHIAVYPPIQNDTNEHMQCWVDHLLSVTYPMHTGEELEQASSHFTCKKRHHNLRPASSPSPWPFFQNPCPTCQPLTMPLPIGCLPHPWPPFPPAALRHEASAPGPELWHALPGQPLLLCWHWPRQCAGRSEHPHPAASDPGPSGRQPWQPGTDE